MFERARHVPLRDLAWNASEAREAVAEIAADAMSRLDPKGFWPAHPLDDNVEDGHTSFYVGATGAIWALDRLGRVGALKERIDLQPLLPQLVALNAAEFAPERFGDYAAHGSLLFGDMGTLLVAMRLSPSSAFADAAFTRAQANNDLPIRELMWGTPGSMIACVHMADMTGEPRWQALFGVQAARLLADLEETELGPLWTQDLYGQQGRWLGPVHGYAGNMAALLRGWNWLTDPQRQRVADAVPRTLSQNAAPSPLGVNWHAIASRETPTLCQHCHGAPGMVTTFADAPFGSPSMDELLLKGGELTWAAGPLAKGPGLCHGTAGNGYAFLKLYRRTGDATWLERARAFAMTAIAQCRETRLEHGRGRYTLWTGDPGLALYLWGCVSEDADFPTIDAF
jgi:hypothetical protein